MDKRFATAFLAVRNRTVLGKKLKPFCLLHRILLDQMGSPILTGGVCRPEDLALALKVLGSSTTEEALERPGFMDVIRAHLISRYPSFYYYAMAGVRTHVQEAWAWPEILKKEDQDGDSRGLPWYAGVLSTLVKHGMSLNEALTLPEGQAVWLYVSIGISDGGQIDILPSELEDELRRVAREQGVIYR